HVLPAEAIEIRASLLRRKVQRAGKDPVGFGPGIGGAAHTWARGGAPGAGGGGPISSRSHAFARIQSRWTVRVETPSASAVSSSESPAKNRHSTTRGSRGSRRASDSSASSSERGESAVRAGGNAPVALFFERDRGDASAPLAGEAAAGFVHEDLAHRARRHGEEMGPVAVARPGLVHELQVGLVDEPGCVDGSRTA